jgi:glycosyltransferase involved in cell wall biosynthesis
LIDPKISVITVCFNSAETILDTLESVASQTFRDIEHIIIDGGSTDGTLALLRSWNKHSFRLVSEPDHGIYDAMNKGIRLATGDIIGILNADDFYADNHVFAKIANLLSYKQNDAVFADLVFVKPNNLSKVVRYYRAANFNTYKFAYGWMPPHPTFFVKREIYERYGTFKTDYRIAADFELLARFMVKHRISYCHLPEVIVKMRTGGASTKNLKSNWILNKEIVRACSENKITTNIFKVYSKYFIKIFQLVGRP